MTKTARPNNAASDINALVGVCTSYYQDTLKGLHFSSPNFDSNAFNKAMWEFAELLDPKKLFLTESDFNFNHLIAEIYDEKELLLIFAMCVKSVYDSYPSRAAEIFNFLKILIAEKRDYEISESNYESSNDTGYAKSPDELGQRWRQQIKLEFLYSRMEGQEESEIKYMLLKRYSLELSETTPLSDKKVAELILQSLTCALDPHSRIAVGDQSTFTRHPIVQLAGVGMVIEQDIKGFYVGRLLPNGPVDRYGKIASGDRIVSVQSDGRCHTAAQLNIGDLIALIRGAQGTPVTLEILKAGQQEPEMHTITREIITLENGRVRGCIISQPQEHGQRAMQIGYIDIPSFYGPNEQKGCPEEKRAGAFEDLEKSLSTFLTNKVDVVLIDLTRNGGGSMRETLDMINLFIDRRKLMGFVGRYGLVSKCADKETIWHGPTVVLTSNDTASGSELMAAAFKTYRRALIVGEQTFGKGTSQSLADLDLPIAEGLSIACKITKGQFVAPDGAVIQGVGVTPDVPLQTSLSTIRESDSRNFLAPVSVKTTNVNSYDLVDGEVVSNLVSSSTERTAQVAQLAVLDDLKNKKKDKQLSERLIPLEETEFRKWHKEQEQQSHLSPISIQTNRGSPDDPTFEDWVRSDPTRREALRVAAEYAALLKKDKY
jgi:carboxyl-terminal processing protease